jgi:transcriptional regulator with XRE-family HTH domain
MNTKSISIENQKRLDILSIYLRELRLNECMNQSEVATDTGLHLNTLIRVENAKNFTILTLFELADFYRMKPSELLTIFE